MTLDEKLPSQGSKHSVAYHCDLGFNRARCKEVIRHINPLMFDVIDDKPEGVLRSPRGLSRARWARVYTISHQS